MSRTDRGGEYIDRRFVEYLKNKGVKIQRTSPYSPQQNDAAERKNRTLRNDPLYVVRRSARK